MAITTIYMCDKCGRKQATAEQFWSIGVVVEHEVGTIKFTTRKCEKQMQVCRRCLELLGFYRGGPTDAPSLPEPPTLEDLIREIARAEVTDLTGAA